MVCLRIAIALVFILFMSPFESQVQQPDPKKMAEMMKATQPGERHKQLESLAGTWDVAVRFKYGGGPERQGKATSEAKWILGGRFLQQEYKSDSGQVTLQFLGYDNQRKKFFEVKIDNMDTGVLHTEGDVSNDGKVITNVGDRTDPLTGEQRRLRIVTTIVDKDHYTVEWFMRDQEGNEEKTVTMMHTRRGAQ